MKIKLMSVLLVIFIAFSLCSCSDETKNPVESETQQTVETKDNGSETKADETEADETEAQETEVQNPVETDVLNNAVSVIKSYITDVQNRDYNNLYNYFASSFDVEEKIQRYTLMDSFGSNSFTLEDGAYAGYDDEGYIIVYASIIQTMTSSGGSTASIENNMKFTMIYENNRLVICDELTVSTVTFENTDL